MPIQINESRTVLSIALHSGTASGGASAHHNPLPSIGGNYTATPPEMSAAARSAQHKPGRGAEGLPGSRSTQRTEKAPSCQARPLEQGQAHPQGTGWRTSRTGRRTAGERAGGPAVRRGGGSAQETATQGRSDRPGRVADQPLVAWRELRAPPPPPPSLAWQPHEPNGRRSGRDKKTGVGGSWPGHPPPHWLSSTWPGATAHGGVKPGGHPPGAQARPQPPAWLGGCLGRQAVWLCAAAGFPRGRAPHTASAKIACRTAWLAFFPPTLRCTYWYRTRIGRGVAASGQAVASGRTCLVGRLHPLAPVGGTMMDGATATENPLCPHRCQVQPIPQTILIN